MAESGEYAITVIGGGPGGYVAAIHASHLGAKVALVEKDLVGGTCLNRGCIPTKALLKSVEVLRQARRAGDLGVNIVGISADLPKIVARKNNVVSTLRAGVELLLKAGKIDVYGGVGRILSPRLIKVNDEEIATKKLIIATGSEPILLPVPGTDLPGVFTTSEILDAKEIPESLMIIGGSHVGVEFASIFSGLGSKVTILKRRPLLLEPIDEEIGRLFAQSLLKQGIDVKIGAAIKAIERQGSMLRVVWDTSQGEQAVQGQAVLLATGRSPYTEGLGLAELGLNMDGPAIAVNECLETNIKGVYAVGDVIGKSMLAHVASYEGKVAVENALGYPRKVDYRAVPSCIFTHPEIAGVGMSEREVRDSGIAYKVSRFPFAASGRAHTLGETAGLVKLICDGHEGKVLGMHIMGPHATDLIAEGALAIQLGATAKDLAHTIHAHPTLSEAVMETALGQLDGSIHYGRIKAKAFGLFSG